MYQITPLGQSAVYPKSLKVDATNQILLAAILVWQALEIVDSSPMRPLYTYEPRHVHPAPVLAVLTRKYLRTRRVASLFATGLLMN